MRALRAICALATAWAVLNVVFALIGLVFDSDPGSIRRDTGVSSWTLLATGVGVFVIAVVIGSFAHRRVEEG